MSNQKKRPCIIPLPNGPLYYFTDFESHTAEGLSGPEGETYSSPKGTALCRCGASKNKPFCDGSHGTIGFSDKKETDGHLDKLDHYVGKKITIHDNRGICSHSAICSDNLASVFKYGEEPWIDPNGESCDAVIEIIKKCPSGALSYSIDGVLHRDQERDCHIKVAKDGPYCITGGIELMADESFEEGASKEHYTLCRCGASKNKPFCDGTHTAIGFKGDE